jgi:mono/diheme cytochrome c family protein
MMRLPFPRLVAVLFASVLALGRACAAEPPAAGPPARISFNRDIRPILSDNCFACHGPDHANRQAGLRLDVAEQAVAELESGVRAIVPGDEGASELIARIVSDDPDSVMPPPQAKIGRLTAAQVQLLTRWITEGATYEPHWAFVPPAKPAVPTDAAPGSQPLDRLVAAGLAKRGLTLQPEADRATLIRRASFDITGLPPTPAEVEAFVADASPDAYERLLDRLLASPRYGERMAADWMDLARYSDSYGFQVDRPRPHMWPWRDWVIKAFNDGLPWDQFTLWQLAGDLLPNATDEQRLATAFNRLHQQESEGGSVEEEYRVNYVNDRTTTFGTAFLGLTLECCRCHDHKFDPLSQKDFYALFAFFDDVDEAGLYSFFTQAVPTPKLRLLDEASAAALAQAEQAVGAATAACPQAEADARERIAAWIAGMAPLPDAFAAAGGVIPGELVRYAFDGRTDDGRFADALGSKAVATSPAENEVVGDARGGSPCTALRLTGDHPVTTSVGNFRRSQPFTVAAWIKPAARYERAVVFHRSKAWTDAGSRGYELLVADGHLRWSLIHFWPGDAASVRCAEPLPVGEWTHVAVSSDGSGRAAGLKVFVNGREAATEVVRDGLTREITGGGGDTITIGERMRDHGLKNGLVDDFRVFDRVLAPLEIRELVTPGTLAAALAEPRDAEALGGYFAAAFATEPALRRQALEAARRQRDDLAERPPEIMVMRDLPEPKPAFVLERGDYDKRGEAVEPNTPAALPPFPADQPRNRLGLARWLVDPDHPLLARVTVNRLWQSLFGLGLVQSPEDLGSQATRPEYPEVLDLLAWQFSHPLAEGGLGWEMKRLVKTIMMSRTYRQRSSADEKTMADDPLNVWLARGPRHRLPAEMIRDGALAASGLLVEQVGGPPVKTYDMPESFKPEKPDSGPALYRRSLYTFWRRTGPGPVLESFDVPKRVVCVARRDTTNTPLHAFVLMNGTQFVEAARVLAERLLAAENGQADPALNRAFLLLTGRRPDDEERAIIRRMHADQWAWYDRHPDEAAKLLAVGGHGRDESLPAVEAAAVANVINALMNYDGCVVKR